MVEPVTTYQKHAVLEAEIPAERDRERASGEARTTSERGNKGAIEDHWVIELTANLI